MASRTFIQRHPSLIQLIESLDPEVTSDSVTTWREKVLDAYDQLAAGLPDDNLWKAQAKQTSERSEQAFLEIAPSLGLEEPFASFVGLLVLTQSLGRLVEAGRKARRGAPVTWGHGRDAAHAFAEAIYVPYDWSTTWQAVLYAVEHRPDAVAPEVESFPKPGFREGAYALMGILRDVVKLEGISPERVGPKLKNPEMKEKLRIENWPEHRRASNPLLGREQGIIAPPSQMQRFMEHLPLIRTEYESYETLMLEILAYLFGVMHEEFVEIIVVQGGPSLIFDYLRRRVTPEQTEKIEQALISWNSHFAARIVLNS